VVMDSTNHLAREPWFQLSGDIGWNSHRALLPQPPSEGSILPGSKRGGPQGSVAHMRHTLRLKRARNPRHTSDFQLVECRLRLSTQSCPRLRKVELQTVRSLQKCSRLRREL
jgi:hypothetical protein